MDHVCAICGAPVEPRHAVTGSGVYRILVCTENPYHQQEKPKGRRR